MGEPLSEVNDLNIRTTTAALVLAAAFSPLPGAGAVSDCHVNTYDAVDLGGLYLYGGELWEESNAEPGLQRTASYCSDGSALAADTCLRHSETFASLECAAEFADSL